VVWHRDCDLSARDTGDSRMSNTMLIVIVAVVAVAALVAGWLFAERRRRERLRTRFGPEYERTLRDDGDPSRAESVLEHREKRVGKYQIRPLSAEESQRFGQAWRQLQARFVDNPSAAVREADALVTELMTLRGYPMTEFDRRAEDLSVDHPTVIQHYRDAHGIAERDARHAASTEDLRQAVVHYRALFEDLLEVREAERKRA
jgi:FtsZ-interacting cell division protein ZipA